MAGASSSANNTCFHCKAFTVIFKNGWRLRSGDFAQLCDQCGSAYENGTFCESFHLHSDGWRDCSICQKMLHCGCIVSANLIIELDYGGVCCIECSKKHSFMVEIEHISSKACPQFWHNLRAQSGDPFRKIEFSVDSEEPVTETNSGQDSVSSAGLAKPSALSPETDVKLFTPGSPCKEQAFASGDIPTANFLGETYLSSEFDLDSARCREVSSGLIHSQHLPKISEGKNLKFLGDSSSGITPLFEKVLTASDTDLKKSRLVIPKKCAEAYFPEVSDPQGMRLKVQDTIGKKWEFNYRYWINYHSKMYVLEGLKDYMVLMQWQPGDIVTFSVIQPEGKLLIGTRKASARPPALRAPPQTVDKMQA